MAIPISEITDGPDYTAAHQLKAWKRASIEVALTGESRSIDGRSLTRSDASLILKMIQFWQTQAQAESGYDGIVYAETLETS
jgi:hypothetical protein